MEPEDFKKSFARVTDLVNRQMAEHLAKLGWSELENDDLVWNKFYEIYKFRPSTSAVDWPGIIEPRPSRTFNIQHIYGPDFDRLTYELSVFYSECFANVIPKGQSMTALPNGDYYIFLTEDLSGGFFGHPWEQTICVMGETFVEQLNNAPSDVFSNLVRIDGVEV